MKVYERKHLAKTLSFSRLAYLFDRTNDLRCVHIGAGRNQMQSGLCTAGSHVFLVAQLQLTPQTNAVTRLS